MTCPRKANFNPGCFFFFPDSIFHALVSLVTLWNMLLPPLLKQADWASESGEQVPQISEWSWPELCEWKGGYLGQTPPLHQVQPLWCLLSGVPGPPQRVLFFKVRWKPPPLGIRLCSPPPLIYYTCLNTRLPCVWATDFSYYGCSVSLFFFFKQGVLFGKGTLVSHTLSPCEFRMHIEVSIIIKEV